MEHVQDGGSGSGLSNSASLSPADMNCSAQDTVELEQYALTRTSSEVAAEHREHQATMDLSPPSTAVTGATSRQGSRSTPLAAQ